MLHTRVASNSTPPPSTVFACLAYALRPPGPQRVSSIYHPCGSCCTHHTIANAARSVSLSSMQELRSCYVLLCHAMPRQICCQAPTSVQQAGDGLTSCEQAPAVRCAADVRKWCSGLRDSQDALMALRRRRYEICVGKEGQECTTISARQWHAQHEFDAAMQHLLKWLSKHAIQSVDVDRDHLISAS